MQEVNSMTVKSQTNTNDQNDAKHHPDPERSEGEGLEILQSLRSLRVTLEVSF